MKDLKFIRGQIAPLISQDYFPALIQAIAGAKQSIDAISYLWHWDGYQRGSSVTILTDILIKAFKRGVAVRVLLNYDHPRFIPSINNITTFKKLRSVGITAQLTDCRPITHSKLFLIDNDITIIGSHNLSKASLKANDETSAIIKSRAVQAVYKSWFNKIMKRY
jgi:phosphatidylserine/phosphatidylglycerophosphate/cardiolipin synthase-like enzyme